MCKSLKVYGKDLFDQKNGYLEAKGLDSGLKLTDVLMSMWDKWPQ